jgi:Uma2 family endonuclease
VDNELQNLIPNLLLTILAFIWQERQDWFLGVDMGKLRRTYIALYGNSSFATLL